jgi:hypothetical protein
MSGVQCSDSAGVQEAPCRGGTRRNEDLRLLYVPYKIRYVNHPSAPGFLLLLCPCGNVILLSVDDDTMCQ